MLEDANIPQLVEQSNNLKRYLHDRRCPTEKNEVFSLKEKISEEIMMNG